jgi:hypothetical protein
MPPSVFSFLHLVIIAFGVMLIIILKGVIDRGPKRVVRFTALTAIGGITGTITSYFLAHIFTPIIQYYIPVSTRGIPQGYSFLFWSVFVCFSMIFIIVGGLTGIIIAKKMESNTCVDTEK